MWHLFQDYENTPQYLQMLYQFSAILASYFSARILCKKKNLDLQKWPVVSTIFGTMIALLFGVVEFGFFSNLLISLVATLLMVRKISAMDW